MKTITLLAATAFCSLPAQDASTTRPRLGQPSTTTPARLPAVVFDRPTEDGPLWAMGRDWKASFDGRGFGHRK